MGCCESRDLQLAENTPRSINSQEIDDDLKKSYKMNQSTMLSDLLFYFSQVAEGKVQTVKQLSLVDRGLTSKNLELLCVLLKELKFLIDLQLVNNCLNEEKILEVSKHFKYISDLQTLNFSCNGLNEVLDDFVENLKYLNVLSVLGLTSNGIKDENEKSIEKILDLNICPSLISLDIRDNEVSFECLEKLVGFCAEKRKVKVFLVENPVVGMSGMEILKYKARGILIEEEF